MDTTKTRIEGFHTLDPWNIKSHQHEGVTGGGYTIISERAADDVAVVFQAGDAKLIRAAPDMLKALLLISDSIELSPPDLRVIKHAVTSALAEWGYDTTG